jgi:hypothetical protein
MFNAMVINTPVQPAMQVSKITVVAMIAVIATTWSAF